ncbi:hypothetical protein EJ05DRAFT_497662 [Pseudovirgaria hyperparasitica]|uniref:Stress response protein ish1 n=1 Tax=Pseudovirgaria hyperparasitica TaxID=470096 RepID=A0A6A6WE51_9PEZI|nr:uncharacterized protein EJ05DRAFT_497662 [Pseudovirgaria hyperparasitica]KAF2761102.1 hypothetical protein EJ05DRAFT_497662 [Pseudovirgaria hyperparasitica]
MKFTLLSTLVVGLAATSSASLFGGARDLAYNKYHENELERWLRDHNVPVPTPADRKNLLNSVKENWDNNVVRPYNSWSVDQSQQYLKSKGIEVKKGTEKNKDALLAQIKSSWQESEAQASTAYADVKSWIFDTWTESQLKAFADKHGIPVPQPRTRDSLLKVVRENSQAAAEKIGETMSYPGDWIYDSWSTSDLKAWFDARGYPVPQPSGRDKLIASLRKNSRQASLSAQSAAASASASAASATESLSEALLNSWSDSDLKAWFDKNGIKVPQGSRRNDLVALARKHSAKLTGDQATQKASSAFHAATTSAGNEYAQATNNAYDYGNFAYSNLWSYVEWAQDQLGLLSDEAKSSAVSARSAASSSASSLASVASKSSSSASVQASKSAVKQGKKAADGATEAATSAKNRVGEAAQKATDYIKEEL